MYLFDLDLSAKYVCIFSCQNFIKNMHVSFISYLSSKYVNIFHVRPFCKIRLSISHYTFSKNMMCEDTNDLHIYTYCSHIQTQCILSTNYAHLALWLCSKTISIYNQRAIDTPKNKDYEAYQTVRASSSTCLLHNDHVSPS